MSTYWYERIEIIKSQIAAIDQALLEFAQDGAKQTVSLDTGQSRISYTRADISSLQRTQERLLVQLQSLERMTGQASSGFYARPGF